MKDSGAAAVVLIAVHIVLVGQPRRFGGLPPVEEPPGFQQLEPAVRRQFVQLQTGLVARIGRPGVRPDIVGRAYGLNGMWHHAYRYHDEAVVYYETAARMDPATVHWPYLVGLILKDQGRTEAAMRAFERARVLAPNYLPLLVAMAETAKDSGRSARAAELLNEGLEHQPGQPRAALNLGQLANEAGDYEKAVELLAPLLLNGPGPGELHYAIAQAYRGLEKRVLATTHFDLARRSQGRGKVPLPDVLLDSVLAMRGDARVFNDRGQGAFARGQLDEAIEAFRNAVHAAPDHISFRINLAMTLLRAGRSEEAEMELERVLRQQPTAPDAHYYLGVLAQGLGQLDRAEQHFVESIRWDPRHVRSRERLAELLITKGLGDDAVAHLERAISADPANSGLRVKLAMLLSTLGKDARSVEILRAAAAALPSNHEPRFLLARILAVSTNPATRDGRSALQMAQELFESQPTLAAAETIAAAFAELGEFDQAVAWQQAAVDGISKADRVDELPWVEQRLRLYLSQQPLRKAWSEAEAEAITFKIAIEPPGT